MFPAQESGVGPVRPESTCERLQGRGEGLRQDQDPGEMSGEGKGGSGLRVGGARVRTQEHLSPRELEGRYLHHPGTL